MIAVNDLLPNMISKFNDLTLFRYALNQYFTDTHELKRFILGDRLRSSSCMIQILLQNSQRQWASVLLNPFAMSTTNVFDDTGCEVVVAGQLFKRLEAEGELVYFTRKLFSFL
jgi:hypothetical protein